MVSMRQADAWTASNLGHPPFEWTVFLPRIFDMRNAHVWQNMATSQHLTRREDVICGMDDSIDPRNSRDAKQHTYKTRGSSSLVVQESKSDIR
jgi:hypothetical protein